MPSFYQNMQKTASGLLKRFGMTVTLSRTVKGAYNPRTGGFEPDTVTEWKPMAVKTGIEQKYMPGYTSMGQNPDGALIQIGDMQLLVDCKGQPYIPATGDTVLFPNGEAWSIVASMPVDPAGTVVLWKGLIRKQ